jgi:hypothetical protein
MKRGLVLIYLVVSLFESLLTETRPVILPVDRLGHFESDIEVSTFDSEIEASCLVLNEMKSDLFNSEIPSSVSLLARDEISEWMEGRKRTSGKPFFCK